MREFFSGAWFILQKACHFLRPTRSTVDGTGMHLCLVPGCVCTCAQKNQVSEMAKKNKCDLERDHQPCGRMHCGLETKRSSIGLNNRLHHFEPQTLGSSVFFSRRRGPRSGKRNMPRRSRHNHYRTLSLPHIVGPVLTSAGFLARALVCGLTGLVVRPHVLCRKNLLEFMCHLSGGLYITLGIVYNSKTTELYLSKFVHVQYCTVRCDLHRFPSECTPGKPWSNNACDTITEI